MSIEVVVVTGALFEFLNFHHLVKYLIGNIIKLHKDFGPNMQINPDHNRGTVQLLTVPIKTPL